MLCRGVYISIKKFVQSIGRNISERFNGVRLFNVGVLADKRNVTKPRKEGGGVNSQGEAMVSPPIQNKAHIRILNPSKNTQIYISSEPVTKDAKVKCANHCATDFRTLETKILGNVPDAKIRCYKILHFST